MKVVKDIHTHTLYSHGENTIEEMVKAAVNAGLEGIHITEHGNAHHTARKLTRESYSEMRAEIERLRIKYPQIEILFGVEANIISTKGDLEFSEEELKIFDVVNAGFHMMSRMKDIKSFFALTVPAVISNKLKIRVFDNKLKRNSTKAMIKCVYQYNLNMITHPGRYYHIDVVSVARACADKGTLLEINSSCGILRAVDLAKLKDSNVRFAIGSDAHSAGRVGDFAKSLEIVKESGVGADRIVNVKK